MSSTFDKEFHTIADWPQLAASQPYPDVVSHQKGLEAAYASITRRLMPFQGALLANADAQLADLSERNRSMRELAAAMDDLVGRAEAGEGVSVLEWQTLDHRARTALAEADKVEARTSKLAADLEDPLSALDALERRLPPLRIKPFTT